MSEPLISVNGIAHYVSDTAKAVRESDRMPEYLVPILNGAYYFGGDLLRALRGPVKLSPLTIKRNREGVPQYTPSTTDRPFAGKRVLIVDTIFDSGGTIAAAIAACQFLGPPTQLDVAVLAYRSEEGLKKFVARYQADHKFYAGKSLDGNPNYLYGYGLDRNGYDRELPQIYQQPPTAAVPESLLVGKDQGVPVPAA